MAKPLTLSEWLEEVDKIGGWIRYYLEMTNNPVSDMTRLEQAISNYGKLPVFEAIHLSSGRTTGDPLSYIMAIAHAKWLEGVNRRMNEDVYIASIEAAKERTFMENVKLAEKLRLAREAK